MSRLESAPEALLLYGEAGFEQLSAFLLETEIATREWRLGHLGRASDLPEPGRARDLWDWGGGGGALGRTRSTRSWTEEGAEEEYLPLGVQQ
jgi:hypothetical protein